MKTTLTKEGWDEVTTTHIEVTQIPDRNPLLSVDDWIKTNNSLRLQKKRKQCHCCKKPWITLTGGVNLIFTNKGNKTVCDNCLAKLKESHEKSTHEID